MQMDVESFHSDFHHSANGWRNYPFRLETILNLIKSREILDSKGDGSEKVQTIY